MGTCELCSMSFFRLASVSLFDQALHRKAPAKGTLRRIRKLSDLPRKGMSTDGIRRACRILSAIPSFILWRSLATLSIQTRIGLRSGPGRVRLRQSLEATALRKRWRRFLPIAWTVDIKTASGYPPTWPMEPTGGCRITRKRMRGARPGPTCDGCHSVNYNLETT